MASKKADISVRPLTTKITKKQQDWIHAVVGGSNHKEACIKAGYRGSDACLYQIGYENSIRLSLFVDEKRKELNAKIDKRNIKSIEEIQERWSNDMDNELLHPQLRMRASENLMKSQGGFIERKEVKQVNTEWFIDDNDEV